MKPKAIKIIIGVGVLVLIGYLLKNFPDYTVLLLGIAIILVIGYWLSESEKT